jgi:hypothetical protein
MVKSYNFYSYHFMLMEIVIVCNSCHYGIIRKGSAFYSYRSENKKKVIMFNTVMF